MSKGIKYFLIILLVLLIVGIGGGFFFYKYYLPKVIAENIQSEDPVEMAFVPKKVQKKIVAAKKSINQSLETMPETLKSLDLTFDDIIYMVENIKEIEVLNTLDEMNSSDLKDVNQIFDIGKRNIKIKGYDLEVFRPLFLEKIKLGQVQNGLKMIEENDLVNAMSVPVARATAKQILLDKKAKIDEALEKVNEP